MNYLLFSDIPNEDIYVSLPGYSDYAGVWGSLRASGLNGSEVRHTYSPWHYYDEDVEEEELSLGHPILWGVGGLVLGALLMALVLKLFRRKHQVNEPLPEPEPPTREELLRKRTLAAQDPPEEEAVYSTGEQSSLDAGPVEVRLAEAIPGETLGMLIDRLQGSLRHAGVSVERKDAGKILAAYACFAGVRLADALETDMSVIRRAAKALSEFFCVSQPRDPEPAAEYLPADSSVPEYFRTDVRLTRLETNERQSYGGINREVFRRILFEEEEEKLLPEDDWKRVDTLLDQYSKEWIGPERHLIVRKMEKISTCLLAAGAERDEALDYALYQALFLRINKKNNRSRLIAMSENFDELFRGREMPLCHGALAKYMPVTETSDTPDTKNQTIHGGEYEPV